MLKILAVSICRSKNRWEGSLKTAWQHESYVKSQRNEVRPARYEPYQLIDQVERICGSGCDRAAFEGKHLLRNFNRVKPLTSYISATIAMTMMALTISVSLTSFFPKNPAERGQTTIPNLNEYADAKLMSPIFRRTRQGVRTR